jgi:hypothetical protein
MPAELPWRFRVFHAVKRGNTMQEYEDAHAAGADLGRFAVADGASESSFAASWARLLAEGFVSAPGSPWQSMSWVAPLRRQWAGEIDDRALPWYAELKRAEGAYATLLGVAFDASGAWHACAVGDSCLFQTRAGRLVSAFPLTAAEEFNNRPMLLGSRLDADPNHAQAHGQWQTGDRFLLMTDAIAEWFLRRAAQRDDPAVCLGLMADAAEVDFDGWVEQRREADGLRNDDVTLLIIDL